MTPTELPPDAAAVSSTRVALGAAQQETRHELLEINRSLRGAVLLFLVSSLVWLLLASSLSLLAWWKMVAPGLLPSVSFLTFGRLWPAQQDAFLYGWLGSGGIGVGLWMMGRLCRVPLRHGGVLLGAWALWNLGLTLGIAGILNGDGTSVQWLEFPRYSSLVLFVGYTFIAIWVVLMFRYRRDGHTYISQWYWVASFLWFPWIYATANLINFFLPVQPAAQEIVHWWYVGNLFGVWLAPMGLAIAYYVVPKTIGHPVHRYSSATFAFWTLLVLSSWSGMVHLIGGPIPAWMITVSIVANTLATVPLFVILKNFTGSVEGQGAKARRSPALRFALVSIYAFVSAGLLGAFTGFRWLGEVTHFTQVTAAQEFLFLYGFVGLSLFGAFYHILPRLSGREWPSHGLIRWHFWIMIVGIGLAFTCLLLGGLLQGLGLEDAKVPTIAILNLLYPFLVTTGIAMLIVAVGNVLFVASTVLILLGEGRHLALHSHAVWKATAPAPAPVEPIPVS